MVKVTVCYPRADDATFDMEYYRTKHREIVMRVLEGVERFEIDQGVDGPYLAMGHLYFPSTEAMQAGMSAPNAGEAMTDLPNFTNTTPVLQVSQIID